MTDSKSLYGWWSQTSYDQKLQSQKRDQTKISLCREYEGEDGQRYRVTSTSNEPNKHNTNWKDIQPVTSKRLVRFVRNVYKEEQSK